MVFHLKEKGGKLHRMPAHYKVEVYLDQYIEQAGLKDQPREPLFRTSLGKGPGLGTERLSRRAAYAMVGRRVHQAELLTRAGCHSFRATGITNYLMNGGTLEKAQVMAAHESARTTKLYDRRGDEVSLDEVERLAI